MKLISVYYFKNKKIQLFIALTFREEISNVILDAIHFFLAESQILDYIQENNLEKSKGPKKIIEFKKSFENYLKGDKIRLFDEARRLNIDLDLDQKFPSDFAKSVIDVVSNLNHGETISYSGIGEKIDSKGYQAIGSAMKNNPLPLVIPCHRVIRKSGELGGFLGETTQSWQVSLKKFLITLEGLILEE